MLKHRLVIHINNILSHDFDFNIRNELIVEKVPLFKGLQSCDRRNQEYLKYFSIYVCFTSTDGLAIHLDVLKRAFHTVLYMFHLIKFILSTFYTDSCLFHSLWEWCESGEDVCVWAHWEYPSCLLDFMSLKSGEANITRAQKPERDIDAVQTAYFTHLSKPARDTWFRCWWWDVLLSEWDRNHTVSSFCDRTNDASCATVCSVCNDFHDLNVKRFKWVLSAEWVTRETSCNQLYFREFNLQVAVTPETTLEWVDSDKKLWLISRLIADIKQRSEGKGCTLMCVSLSFLEKNTVEWT